MEPLPDAETNALSELLDAVSARLTVTGSLVAPDSSSSESPDWIAGAMARRTELLAASVRKTVAGCSDLQDIARLFLDWMNNGRVVRVVGAGRARLAASIPANRLAHGGARVFVQDDIIPMPHTVVSGGIIAASASGSTPSVLNLLNVVRRNAPEITVVGIAHHGATAFSSLCRHFVGIRLEEDTPNPLSALADMGEYVISEVLDALVVAAGRLGGFDDRRWRLGHENIGATGPYYAAIADVDLLFSEF
jgi:D-arabinose 5-phosphate isomerase GutQ